jgi:drug/metabolite transporter (DMT)-like permease
MLSLIYGLAAALSWGMGDFGGGLASRRSHVYTVILGAQLGSFALLVALALITREALPNGDALLWGAVSGMFGAFGLITMYRSLARMRMGVVTPILAVIMTSVPVAFSMIFEGLPTPTQMIGFAIALAAIWLISGAGGSIGASLGELREPIISGLLFGGFLVALDRAGDAGAGVFYPIIMSRVVSISILLALATVRGVPRFPPRERLPLIVGVGIADVFGNAFYVLATQVGRLDLATVISSLYPAVTVLLAWLILKETLSRRQGVGVLIALLAIVLITR